MKFLPDAFNSKHFTNYFVGNILSCHAIQIFMFAGSWVVHELNESPEALGILGLYASLPTLMFNVFGGAIADRYSKKLIVSICQLIFAFLLFVFAYYYGAGLMEYWHVYIIAGLISFVMAFENPARMSYFPYLLEKDDLSSGVVVDLFAWQGTRVVAPLIAGFIFAVYGGSTALILASIFMITFISILYTTKPIHKKEKLHKGNPLTDVLEGLKYVYSNKPMVVLLSMSFLVYLAGYAYLNMIPYIGVQIFGVGSKETGLLLSGTGIGAVLPTIIFSKSGIPNKRIGACFSLVFSGLMIIIFSLSSLIFQSIIFAFILIVFIGFCNSVYVTSVMSAIQIYVNDKYRARVVGIFVMSFSFMSLGSLWVGMLGGFIDEYFSLEHVGVLLTIAFGGLILSVVGLTLYYFNNSLKEIS